MLSNTFCSLTMNLCKLRLKLWWFCSLDKCSQTMGIEVCRGVEWERFSSWNKNVSLLKCAVSCWALFDRFCFTAVLTTCGFTTSPRKHVNLVDSGKPWIMSCFVLVCFFVFFWFQRQCYSANHRNLTFRLLKRSAHHLFFSCAANRCPFTTK